MDELRATAVAAIADWFDAEASRGTHPAVCIAQLMNDLQARAGF